MSSALRDSFREGYGLASLRGDLLSGLVVGIVALPLSMALAIASGVPPQHGLYTAIVAGTLIAVFGGSRTQVCGPTAAFVVILTPITAKYGLAGLATASVLAGLIQIAMGTLKLGRLIQFVPHPVTTGFTAGIAVVIATLQLKDLFGLTIPHMPEPFISRVAVIALSMPTFRPTELAVGGVTLLLLWAWTKWGRVVPAPLVALTVAAVMAVVIGQVSPDHAVATIQSRFGQMDAPFGIPQRPPMPVLPWMQNTAAGPGIDWSWATAQDLTMAAMAIALLGAIESLLSAVVADGMTGHSHDSDVELTAQGIGNVIAPFFGGFAATGAIARTAANIRFGGRTPISSITHAAFLFLSLIFLAPLLGYLPMAAMAALLMMVAWNMSESRHFIHTLHRAPGGDIAVLLTCFGLTIVFDMAIAVMVGVVLAAMLIIARVTAIADSRIIEEHYHELDIPLPSGTVVYEVGGSLFFGAAQRALAAIANLTHTTRIVVIDLRSVAVMDITGLTALESALICMHKKQIHVIVAGIQKQPLKVMAKAGFARDRNLVTFCGDFEHGVQMAHMLGHLILDDDEGEVDSIPKRNTG